MNQSLQIHSRPFHVVETHSVNHEPVLDLMRFDAGQAGADVHLSSVADGGGP